MADINNLRKTRNKSGLDYDYGKRFKYDQG